MRDRVGVVAVGPEPVEQDLARHLGVELHAPGGLAEAEAVDRDRRAGEQRRVLGQLDAVGVPAVGAEALGQRAEQRVRRGLGQRLDLVPADLRVGDAHDLAARGRDQQLRAEADAEQRLAALERRADQRDLVLEVAQARRVGDVLLAAEHDDPVVAGGVGGSRLADAGAPLVVDDARRRARRRANVPAASALGCWIERSRTGRAYGLG